MDAIEFKQLNRTHITKPNLTSRAAIAVQHTVEVITSFLSLGQTSCCLDQNGNQSSQDFFPTASKNYQHSASNVLDPVETGQPRCHPLTR
ncbi:hypothetical protein SLA2020_425290 [Shorea laevis]